MKKTVSVALVFVISTLLLVSVGCGKPHFDNEYENSYFKFEYPLVLEIKEVGDSKIEVAEVGYMYPMMVVQMLEYKGLTEGDVLLVKERYLRANPGSPAPEIIPKRVSGIKSIFFKVIIPGGFSGGVSERHGYYVPLADMVLFVEFTPQIPEDIDLAHRIVETLVIK
ncbi:MAG: hypothetical protein KAH30_07315 [Caldisericia bacterium]|nr:hypothetical protein [Caldisericia bacterium]